MGKPKNARRQGTNRPKGAVMKYGTEGGGRDLIGSAKLLDEKCWASKIFQVISMSHEGICSQYFTIVLKTFSIIFCCSLDHWHCSPSQF